MASCVCSPGRTLPPSGTSVIAAERVDFPFITIGLLIPPTPAFFQRTFSPESGSQESIRPFLARDAVLLGPAPLSPVTCRAGAASTAAARRSMRVSVS
jgi:hypothetical protein